jgi:hypothetical protein
MARSERKLLQKFISKPIDLSRYRARSHLHALWQNYHSHGLLARQLVIAKSKRVQCDGHKNLKPPHSILPQCRPVPDSVQIVREVISPIILRSA